MRLRKLGRTNWKISEIGFGAWGIGRTWWGTTDDKESLAAIQAAWEAGINFYDTAYVYGDGHSEELLGKGLKGKKAVMATKIPPKNQEAGEPQDSCGKSFPKRLDYLLHGKKPSKIATRNHRVDSISCLDGRVAES